MVRQVLESRCFLKAGRAAFASVLGRSMGWGPVTQTSLFSATIRGGVTSVHLGLGNMTATGTENGGVWLGGRSRIESLAVFGSRNCACCRWGRWVWGRAFLGQATEALGTAAVLRCQALCPHFSFVISCNAHLVFLLCCHPGLAKPLRWLYQHPSPNPVPAPDSPL